MQRVVNSDVFTDEQKVLIIEAINKKQIVIDFEPTFEQLNNSYFIKSGKKYIYVLQFCNGFKYYEINSEYYNQHHAIFNEYTLSENTTRFWNPGIYYYCDNVNLFPYAKYDKSKNSIVVINQSQNHNILKYIMSKFGFSTQLSQLIEIYSNKEMSLSQPIENIVSIMYYTNDFIITYIDKKFDKFSLVNNPIETKNSEKNVIEKSIEIKTPEKNEIDKRVEKLPKSADYKNLIETEQLEKVKTYILDEIEQSIKNKSHTTDLSYDKIPKSIRQQTEQFIKSICKDKDYIFGTTQFGYSLILYLP